MSFGTASTFILSVVAGVVADFIADQIRKWLDDRREKRNSHKKQ